MSEEDIVHEKPSMDWLLTFADLVSLLITFFVLLYSMKVVETQQWEALKGSFSGVFSIREKVIDINPTQDATVEKIDPFKADNLDYINTLLNTRFHANEVLKQAKIEKIDQGTKLVISLPTNILFDPGATEVNEDGASSLAEFGDALRHLDNRIEVAGHTDPFPTNSEEFPTNWELAMVRAIRVATILKEQGIESHITAVSFAHSRFDELDRMKPLDERYEEARRVEIIIFNESGDPYGDIEQAVPEI